MKRIISLFLSLIASCLLGTTYAQESALMPSTPEIVPQPPEVSRLIGMINYPVSYNTGLVKTEIPLFEIKTRGGYTLPVRLVYRSSGFKPHERSVVGAGWSLEAEPQIAHAVNGLPDEMPVYGLYMNEGTNLPDQETQVDAMYGYYDIQPDQYFYILPQKGGSFFLNRPANGTKKEFVTVPYDPVRIDNSADLKTFTLTDTDGVAYTFTPQEETETVTEDRRTTAISVYKASRIMTPNKEVIAFEYGGLSTGQPFRYMLHNYEQSATLEIKKKRYATQDIDYWNGMETISTDEFSPSFVQQRVKLVQRDVKGRTSSSPQMETSIYYVDEGNGRDNNPLKPLCDEHRRFTSYWTQTVSTRHLKKITFPGGSMEFTYMEIMPYQTARKYLNAIVVKNDRGEVVRRFQLVNSRYGERPRLDAVMEMGKDGQSYRTYSFTYHHSTGVGYDDPRVNAWGYYSTQNATVSQALVPRLWKTFGLYSDKGELTDSLHFQYGRDDFYQTPVEEPFLPFMLASVTYPTGGRTEFEYEHNRFYEESRGREVTDGSVRIREIRNYLEDGTLATTRRFKYGKGESGRGLPVRVLEPIDFMTAYHQQVYRVDRSFIAPDWNEAYPIYKVDLHARPVVNDYLESSASIVYDCVTEYMDADSLSGKTVYEYDYSEEKLAAIRSTRSASPPVNPTLTSNVYRVYGGWQVGQLLRKSVYDSNGLLIREEKNAYRTMPGDEVAFMQIYTPLSMFYEDGFVTNWETIRALKIGAVTPNLSGGAYMPKAPEPERYRYSGFDFYSGYKLMKSSETTEYRDGRAHTQSVSYEYNGHLLPVKTVRHLDGSLQEVETMEYPEDFTDDVSRGMVGMNWLTPVLRRTVTSGNTSYDIHTPYRMTNGIFVPDRLESGKDGQPRETRVRFVRYDRYGSPLEIQTDSTKRVEYLWGYNSLYPVAKVEHACPDLPSTSWGYASVTDSAALDKACASLRESLRGKAAVSSYTYSPLEGLTSVTDPDGNRTSFVYNTFGELARTFDRDGACTEEYAYHYTDEGKYTPLSLNIFKPETCLVDEAVTFEASISSGNGGYQYQWVLTDSGGNQVGSGISESASFTHTFKEAGTYRLTCSVTDAAGMLATRTISVEVTRDMSVGFDYIYRYEEGGRRYMEAYITPPVDTEITFVLLYKTFPQSPDITYWINDEEFKRTGDSGMNDFVTVKFEGGKRARVMVECSPRDLECRLQLLEATNGVTIRFPLMLE